MPKKRRNGVIPTKPGAARCYVLENYSDLTGNIFKNGHALYAIFHECGNSYTETARYLQEKLGPDVKVSSVHVRRLLEKTVRKFKNLAHVASFAQFKIACDKEFTLFTKVKNLPPESHPSAEETELEPVAGSSTEPEPVADPSTELEPGVGPSTERSPTSAVRSSKRHAPTPREAKLKERLDFVTLSKSAEKERLTTKIRELKLSLKSSKSQQLRNLARQLKRKEETIAKKDQKIMELRLARSRDAGLQKEIALVREMHIKMERYTHQ